VSEYVDDEAYPRVVNATRINLGFLRKANRDQQTTRSIEIPACRGFMLAERTKEHRRLFREGIEAEFFEGFDELLAKCRHYLVQEDERRRIAENGHRRCIFGGYSYEGRLLSVLEHAMEITPQVVHEGASVTRLPFAPGRLKVQSA
jgi:spore maturation protein CgeB